MSEHASVQEAEESTTPMVTEELVSQEDQAASTPAVMERLLAEEVDRLPTIRRGDVVDGVVVSVDRDGVLVNIGAKWEGTIPEREMRSLSREELDQLRAGDEVVVYVLRFEEGGQTILSFDRARAERGWRHLQQEMETEAVVEASVTGYNRGGLLVETDGVQGFVPLSHLSPAHRSMVQLGGDESALGQLVGERLEVKVIELNRRRERAILSERMAQQELKEERRERLVSELYEGSIRRGRVTGIQNFGAFVDLGGADGLIHISELSWEPVASPGDVVEVGQELDVYILKVDSESKRISLSLRRTQADPWQQAANKYHEGELVQGTITRLTAFGAFARLDENVEGLIHISELENRHIRHPREVVKEGDVCTLKVLRIEPERRRLGLSLRQVEE